jgi:hypothetical protein
MYRGIDMFHQIGMCAKKRFHTGLVFYLIAAKIVKKVEIANWK